MHTYGDVERSSQPSAVARGVWKRPHLPENECQQLVESQWRMLEACTQTDVSSTSVSPNWTRCLLL